MTPAKSLYTKLAAAALTRVETAYAETTKTAAGGRRVFNSLNTAMDAASGAGKAIPQVKPQGTLSRLFDVFGSHEKQLASAANTANEQLHDARDTVGKLQGKLRNYDQAAETAARRGWWDNGGRWMAGLGAAGAVAAPGAYALGQHQGRKNKQRHRNMAFGAGVATGLAAPGMAQAATNKAQNMINTYAPQVNKPPRGGYE